MPIPFLNAIDLNRNEIQNVRVQNLATAPTHAAGLIYYDTATGLLGVSNGTAWTYLAVGALDTEAVQDVVGAMGAGSSVVTATYNDTTGVVVYTIGANQITNAMVNTAAAISGDKLVDGTTNKLLTATERTKLSGIATGATANATDAALRARSSHTGTQTADTITDGTTNKAYTAVEQTKLAGVAAGATVNSTDAILLARANHTGTQTTATISDFTTAVNAIVAGVVDAAPLALDTLNELAAALGDDPNFAATMTTALGLKANTSSLAAVATTGTYASLTAKPTYFTTVGDNTATSYVITHALGTRNCAVTLFQSATPWRQVATQVDMTSTTTTTLTFGAAPTVGQYTVYITAV